MVDNFREKFGRGDAVLDTLHTTLAGVEKQEKLQTEGARIVDKRLEDKEVKFSAKRIGWGGRWAGEGGSSCGDGESCEWLWTRRPMCAAWFVEQDGFADYAKK